MREVLHRAPRAHHHKNSIAPPSVLLVFKPAFFFVVEQRFSGDLVDFVPGPGGREGGSGVITVQPDESELRMVLFGPKMLEDLVFEGGGGQAHDKDGAEKAGLGLA